MKRLVALSSDIPYVDRYIVIRNSKRLATKYQLTIIHAYVVAQFDAYCDAVDSGELHSLLPDVTCAAKSDVLRACYDGPTNALKQLKNIIKSVQPTRQLKYCPMCGTTLPTTFDHYLPAVRYPEFSVHALNLVPCCSQCNSIKDDDWLDAHGGRQYMHAFVDEIPDEDFLTATLHEEPLLSGVGVTFDLTRPAGLSDAQWAFLKSHVERLHLTDRYNHLGNDEVAEIIADCRIHSDEGGRDVSAFLLARAAERRQTHGRNHWRAVLMDAMAAHPRLDVWIDSSRPEAVAGI